MDSAATFAVAGGVLLLVGVAVFFFKRGGGVTVVDVRPPSAPLAQSVESLLREGRKIEAIKLYREQTGLGLKEAKDAVEAMARGETLPRAPTAVPAPAITRTAVSDAEIDELLKTDRLIEAVKLVKDRTGLGLKESKDLVDARRAALKR